MEPPEKRETLNQILSEMDGFKQTNKIIIIGATNIEESLDPAIMRAGRFDKVLYLYFNFFFFKIFLYFSSKNDSNFGMFENIFDLMKFFNRKFYTTQKILKN